MPRFALILSALLLATGTASPSSAETYPCRVEKKRYCALDQCRTLPAKGEVTVIDTEKRRYLLCAAGGKCESFPLESIRHSGVFIIFFATPGAYLKMVYVDLKNLGPTLGSFVEVRSHFLGAFMSWGRCVKSGRP